MSFLLTNCCSHLCYFLFYEFESLLLYLVLIICVSKQWNFCKVLKCWFVLNQSETFQKSCLIIWILEYIERKYDYAFACIPVWECIPLIICIKLHALQCRTWKCNHRKINNKFSWVLLLLAEMSKPEILCKNEVMLYLQYWFYLK